MHYKCGYVSTIIIKGFQYQEHPTYWLVKVLCVSYEFMSTSVMSCSSWAKTSIYYRHTHSTKQLTNQGVFTLARLYQAKQQKIQSQTLIVCEKSQTFQSTVTVRACQPHWLLHCRKYLNLWFWSRFSGESWCAKELQAETWMYSSSAWKKKKHLRAGRTSLSAFSDM